MSIEAMKLALEALLSVWEDGEAITALRAAIEQAEKHEPVAWFTEDHREDKSATTYSKKMSERWKEKGWPVTPLYTAPPQREWVGLTDEEIEDLYFDRFSMGELDAFARAIEAKLKEKNT